MPRSYSQGRKTRRKKKPLSTTFFWSSLSIFLLCIVVIESLILRSLFLERNRLKEKLTSLENFLYRNEREVQEVRASYKKIKKEKKVLPPGKIVGKKISTSKDNLSNTTKKDVSYKTKNISKVLVKKKKAMKKLNTSRPKLAIVLDDWGYSKGEIDMLPDIKIALDISIFPHHKFSSLAVWASKKLRKEIMLHLPMQPENVPKKGWEKDTIVVGMPEGKIKEIVESAIDSVDGCRGMNNHMGSLATTNRKVVKTVISIVKRHKMFVVDSLSSANSVMCDVAKELGVDCIKRDVFLDNNLSEDYIRGQIKQAISVAKKKGYAVAIGHAHLQTLNVLRDMQDEIKREVDVVFVSDLIKELKRRKIM